MGQMKEQNVNQKTESGSTVRAGEQGSTGTRGMERRQPEGLGAQRGYGARHATPFSLMSRMMEDMDRLFGFGGGWGAGFGPLARADWTPQVEVFERNGNLVVRADLPGLDRNDVKVNVEDDAITIQGERRAEHEEKREGYFHSERSYGSFQRRVPLPRGADASSCDATFDNGVLEVTVKLPKSTTRNVQIRGAQQQAAASSPATTAPTQAQPQNGPQARS